MTIGRNTHLALAALIAVPLALSVLVLSQNSRGEDTKQIRPTRLQEAVPIDLLSVAQTQISRLRRTADQLRVLAVQPMPGNLSPEEQAELVRHTQWLRDASHLVRTLADNWEQRLQPLTEQRGFQGKSGLRLEDLNTFFQLQTLGLKRKLQRENGQISLDPESVRASYRTAKVVINNMK